MRGPVGCSGRLSHWNCLIVYPEGDGRRGREGGRSHALSTCMRSVLSFEDLCVDKYLYRPYIEI